MAGLLGTGWNIGTKQSGPPRQNMAPKDGTLVPSLAAIFGEDNPAQVSDTPRTVSKPYPNTAEPASNAPLATGYGWIFRPAQTKGMNTLYIDQIRRLPEAGISAGKVSAIKQSDYAPFNHYRTSWWMYAGWDPIFRFANTYMDLRMSVGKPPPLSAAQPQNLPFGSRQSAPYMPSRWAWLIPRFSTEPRTVTPQSGQGGSKA